MQSAQQHPIRRKPDRSLLSSLSVNSARSGFLHDLHPRIDAKRKTLRVTSADSAIPE